MRTLLATAAFSVLASSATAECGNVGIVDLNISAVVTQPGVALISPAGSAPSLAAQGLAIEIGVYDCEWNPIAGYPADDIWVDDPGDGSIALCRAGSVADAATGADGLTGIGGTISGGGFTTAGTQIYVSGIPVDAPPLPLQFRSADLDGDLAVDLTDLGEFGFDFGSTAARSDLHPDGTVNLLDFAVFGSQFGETCP